LVFAQSTQRLEDCFEAVPAARRFADPAVDDERIRVLGNLWVEVVLDHPVRGLDLPVATGELAAARPAHRARRCKSMKGGKGGHGWSLWGTVNRRGCGASLLV